MNGQLRAARANYYKFLARLYASELDSEMLEALKNIDVNSDTDNKTLKKGLGLLKKFVAEIPSLEELAADYAKIFLAAGEAKGGAAFPYESVYTSKEKLLMQDSWEQVRKFYVSRGLALVNAPYDVKEDHIASELSCMAYLVENEQDNEAGEFLSTHLLNWADKFVSDIEKYANYNVYPAIGNLTLGFLEIEHEIFTQQEGPEKVSNPGQDITSFQFPLPEWDKVLASLKGKYRVFAPVLQNKRGTDKPVVRYSEINSASEIYNERSSDFSAKEIYYPVMQTMFYFTENEVFESQANNDKEIIILLHPCDINAMRRLDNIFINNGAGADMYYSRLRGKVHAVLLECKTSSDNCYCVSMGSNTAGEYEFALRISGDSVAVHVKNPEWLSYFSSGTKSDFTPSFITENKRQVSIPEIPDRAALKTASELKYWEKFNDSCISCGGCNTVCPTCSCFDTNDVIYSQTSREGERRRVWSSCMLETFTQTAGGARARKTPGANMRFKALHKIYDYRMRFGGEENMCVGCGRCITRCPKELDFAATLNEFSDELKKVLGR